MENEYRLQEKIEASIALIRKGERLALAMNPNGYIVYFSGGKDSLVLLELVRMSGVKYEAVYNVTGIDAPESIYYIRQFPEVKFNHPKQNFFKLVEKWGMPTMQRRYCCKVLKEGEGAGRVCMTGVRKEESCRRSRYPDVKIFSNRKEHKEHRNERKSFEEIEANEHRCIKGKDKIMVYPILEWTKEEVWEFIIRRQLPVNVMYNYVERVGCMFCPFCSDKQIEMYCEMYPRFKQLLLRSMGRYIEKKGGELKSAEEMFDWWRSRKSIEEWKKQNSKKDK